VFGISVHPDIRAALKQRVFEPVSQSAQILDLSLRASPASSHAFPRAMREATFSVPALLPLS